MKIIIIGAGQVGGTLAENLASEENDITVIDQDSARLRELQDRLDIRTVYGQGSHPNILAQAGAEDADMLARPHAVLDVQDRAGARKLQHAEALIRERADDMHYAVALVSCHASAVRGLVPLQDAHHVGIASA